eukprot:TRINITY_DN66620_c6_g1_i1.p1 TRINITY_DN66620_c6_g1~~TRINITY_DN66620_c6_g1_i1.p1  ORF type:complete len:497 (-),score=58.20 TRINITY_DN66620_c6_g1_i1:505-1950(-)
MNKVKRRGSGATAITSVSNVSSAPVHSATQRMRVLLQDLQAIEQHSKIPAVPFTATVDAVFSKASAELSTLKQQCLGRVDSIHRLMLGRIIVVDLNELGHFRSIASAVQAAQSGDTVVVRGGTYVENITIDTEGFTLQPGRPDTVTIESCQATPVFTIRAAATVRGFNIDQQNPTQCAILITAPTATAAAAGTQSSSVVDDHVVGQQQQASSPSSSSSPSPSSSPPPPLGCTSLDHHHGGGGVWSGDRCCVFEDCVVQTVNLTAISVSCAAIIKACRIQRTMKHGIHITNAANPLIEDNIISANGKHNILVGARANPTIRHNMIKLSGGNNINVQKRGCPLITMNTIHDGTDSNIMIETDANPQITNNKIHHSRKCGVCFAEFSEGTLEGNDIYENAYSNVICLKGSTGFVTDNNVHHSQQHGMTLRSGSTPTVVANYIWSNALNNLKVEQPEDPNLVHKENITTIAPTAPSSNAGLLHPR